MEIEESQHVVSHYTCFLHLEEVHINDNQTNRTVIDVCFIVWLADY